MKIRIFKRIVDGVFDVRIQTEDWSQHDIDLMVKYGEPEINLGGEIAYVPVNVEGSSSSGGTETVLLDDNYARIMTESPFTYKFDSRDYDGVDNARQIASAWASEIEARIADKVRMLRDKDTFFNTEEIMEY
jgi:hypothetical protein